MAGLQSQAGAGDPEKLRLLESDRKAYFEVSQANMKENREAIQTLRGENKELKATLRSLSKALEGVNDSAIRSSEINRLDDAVGKAKRQYDQLRSNAARKVQEASRAKEQLQALQKESEPILEENSPLNRKIRLLESRLDKSLIKFNEAQSIRRTYEQIVKRLQDERIGFDNQLAAIERTLKAKDHDYRELLNMSHDASHAKEIAKAELAQFRTAYEEERRQKDRELQERKGYAQSRIDQTQRLEKRENARRAAELESQQRAAEERNRVQGLQALQDAENEEHDEEEKERQQELASLIEHIKDVAGENTVQGVIKKYLAQEETHRNLVQVTKETQEKISDMQVKKAELKARVEELKWTATGQLGSRRIVEEFTAHLADAQARCDQGKAKYEKVAKLFINVRAGVEHLYGLLLDVKMDIPSLTINDNNVVEALRQCETKLMYLVEDVLPGENAGQEGAPTPPPVELSDLSMVELPSFNTRVRTGMDDDASASDTSEEEEEEDVLDRNMVKKLAALALAREAKKAKKRGKQRKDGES